MEELGLGDPLGSLSSDLANFLDGPSFVGSGLEQPFLGELEAIATRLEMPHTSYDDPEVKAEDLPSSSAAAVLSQDEDAEETGGHVSSTKRRRRTRTERQQVLNRLAQQRYRQRKKEKVQALQSTVGTLQSQLDRLSFLEAENAELRATTAQLGQQVAAKDAALLQVQLQLRASAVHLRGQQERCTAQERQLAEAQQTLEAQRQQLRASSLAGLDPQALSDRLLAVIREALAEASVGSSGSGSVVAASGGGGGGSGASGSSGVAASSSEGAGAAAATAPPLLSEEVLARISRTLTSCCRELVYSNKMVTAKQAAAAADTPSAIPVSCC